MQPICWHHEQLSNTPFCPSAMKRLQDSVVVVGVGLGQNANEPSALTLTEFVQTVQHTD